MRRSTRVALLTALGLVLWARSARGQDADGKESDAEKTCEKAAKALTKGHPEKKDLWAFSVIVKCPGAGALLAAGWSPVPIDSTELFSLSAASVSVADVRILNAILVVVQNTSVAQAARRIAIDVALSQYAPDIRVGNGGWASPDERASLGRMMDYYQVAGEQPITEADRQQIVEAFRAMGTTDPDPQIRRVATLIVRELSAVCGTVRCYRPPGSGP